MIIVGQVFVLSSLALIFIFGLGFILTSTLDISRRTKNTKNEKKTIIHGIDATRNQEWWYDKFNIAQMKALNMWGDLIEVRGVKTLISANPRDKVPSGLGSSIWPDFTDSPRESRWFEVGEGEMRRTNTHHTMNMTNTTQHTQNTRRIGSHQSSTGPPLSRRRERWVAHPSDPNRRGKTLPRRSLTSRGAMTRTLGLVQLDWSQYKR